MHNAVEGMSTIGLVQEWAALIRDVGVIAGVPVLIGIGVKLYSLQHKAAEAQIKANEAQIKVIEAQNAALKDTQYDKALALLKSQEELFGRERKEYLDRIELFEQSEKETQEALDKLAEKIDVAMKGIAN